MLNAISFKIYELRKYLVLSLVISMIAIPIADTLVVQRDRNRNEMYGEAFWIYGFAVYNMTDLEVAEAMGEHFQDGNHVLPDYLGNITYEYPVFGLIFFAIATFLFPGVSEFQHMWLNFLLALVFNLNLVLMAILLKDKIYKVQWARLFFAGYFMYGLILSAGGGKLEPLTDCLLLMALVLRSEGQNNKAMFTLGLSFQTKIYSLVALPVLFLSSPVSLIWFFASIMITIVPLAAAGQGYDSLLSHFLNSSSYSSFIVNPIYPGLSWETPDIWNPLGGTYSWYPALIPLVIVVGFILITIHQFLPNKEDFMKASWWGKIKLLQPLYLYAVPCSLFIFRWVMPWYLFWFGALIFLFDDDRQAIAYLKLMTIIGLLYAFGVIINFPYFWEGPLPDLLSHFPMGLWTYGYLAILAAAVVIVFIIWRWTFNRREVQAKIRHDAEARGELVI
ncbi:MAG: hypothetical protein ACFFDR_05260 [Candidatus Thorarchaeota archaeon]